jgi:hypothetical protein
VSVVAAIDTGAVDRDVELRGFAGSDLDGVADGVLVMDGADDVPGRPARLGHELDGLLESGSGPTGDREVTS